MYNFASNSFDSLHRGWLDISVVTALLVRSDCRGSGFEKLGIYEAYKNYKREYLLFLIYAKPCLSIFYFKVTGGYKQRKFRQLLIYYL